MDCTVLKSIMTELSPQELEECKDDFGYFARADFRAMLEENNRSGAFYLGGLNKDEDGRYSPTKDFAIATAIDNINADRFSRYQQAQQISQPTNYQQPVQAYSIPEELRPITIPSNNGYLIIKPKVDENNRQQCTYYKDTDRNYAINVPQYDVKWRGQVANQMEYAITAELDVERLRNDPVYQQFVAQQFLSPERLQKISDKYHGYAGLVMEDNNTGKLCKYTRNLEEVSNGKDNQYGKNNQECQYDSYER